MDSGNSQSSSGGGDEEYDSRAATGFISNHPPPPAPQAAAVFDPQLSNYLQLYQNSNTNNNSNNNNQFLNSNISWPTSATTNNNNSPAPSNLNHVGPVRNPKKRSRASRRAPTTVLTTDTSNFRAMVQEFTGIPAQPFSTTRLDLLGARSSSSVPQSYLRRPFPHKLQSSTINHNNNNNNNYYDADHHHITTTIAAAVSSTTSTTTNSPILNNYQQLHTSNLFNMSIPNPLLLQQTNPTTLFPFSNSPHSFGINLGFDNGPKFGLNNIISPSLAGLPNLVSSDHKDDHAAVDEYPTTHEEFRAVNGSYNLSRINNNNNNSNNATSTTNGENTTTTRGGEGMVESWISSSD